MASLQSRLADLITSVGDAFKADRARLDAIEASDTFTPVFTFETPGDVSVSYVRQTGYYSKIGNLVTVMLDMTFTPTYSSSSGGGRITGLPYGGITGTSQMAPVFPNNLMSWGAGDTMTMGLINGTGTQFELYTIGSGSGRSDMGTTTFPSGSQRIIRITGSYFTE